MLKEMKRYSLDPSINLSPDRVMKTFISFWPTAAENAPRKKRSAIKCKVQRPMFKVCDGKQAWDLGRWPLDEEIMSLMRKLHGLFCKRDLFGGRFVWLESVVPELFQE